MLPEHFALLPIPPLRLAASLLAAAFVGVGPAVTALAFAALFVFAVQLGPVVTLVALPLVALQLVFALLLSRVAIAAAGSAMRSRLGLEFVALQYALVISLSTVGWALFAGLGEGGTIRSAASASGDLPAGLDTLVRIAPSGWGAVALEAVERGAWGMAIAGVGGLIAIDALLLGLWARMLTARLTSSATSATTAAAPRIDFGERLRPATPLGAAIVREGRRWLRDPRSAIEWRVAMLCGLLIPAIPALVGWPHLWPFAGAVLAVLATTSASNSYGLEGSAWWVTMMAPGAIRTDVRARQWAYLALFAPVALIFSIGGLLIADRDWALPWVAAIVPPMLIGGAGVMIIVSVLGAVPVPESARRSGNLLAAADNTGPAYLAMLSVLALAGPSAAVLAWLGSVAASLVGVTVGVGAFWLGGEWATRALERGAPELLDILRHGRSAATGDAGMAGMFAGTQDGWRRWAVIGSWSLFWLPLFPQGLVPAAFKLAGVEDRVWFLALYLPDPWHWPVIALMIATGLALIWTAVTLSRDPAQASP